MLGLTSGDDSVSARFLAVAILSAVAASSAARAQAVSPQVAACHEHATKRYIADFRQVGPARVSFDHPMLVTGFENNNPRYQDYFSDCMTRKDTEKAN